MQFFRYFPQISYTFSDGSPFTLDLTNPAVHVLIAPKLKQNITVLYDYIIPGNDRPDTVARKVYGSANYTWIVLVLNNIMSLFDWPLSIDEFNAYITDKYTTIGAAQAQTLYKTNDGAFVDSVTYGLLPASRQGATLSMYDYELELNENKRRIKVVPTEFAPLLQANLKQILRAN